MTRRLGCSLLALVWLAVANPAAAKPARVPEATVLDQIDRIVRTRFYSVDVLRERGWDQAVSAARAELAGATPAKQREILARLVAVLATSHTEYIAPDHPRHAQIISIFEEILPKTPDRCPDVSKLPPLPIEISDAGVWWTQRDGRWFVGGVIDGGPAKTAGLLLGDEVVTADGRPFQPTASLSGTKPVRLAVRRTRGGRLRAVTVTPRRTRPQESFRSAIGASARIIERGKARIGYVRVWSWAGETMQSALEDAIASLNEQRPTSFVLDLRDGWGGASPGYLRIFDTDVPVLESTGRDGKRWRRDATIRVPAVALINGGSRSGKEIIAYGIKKHRLARLVGENTAGAVLPGGVFCLDDGALLYLASSALTVDGEVLEGKGVAPDVAVPFDIRHAGGRDRQLDAALLEAVALEAAAAR